MNYRRSYYFVSFAALAAVGILSFALLSPFDPISTARFAFEVFPAAPLSFSEFAFLLAVSALIAVASAPPAPVRSFLRRLTARTRDPVPSTI